jgi:hypothetical protein
MVAVLQLDPTEMAEKATDARDREGWLRLAQDWIELAEQGGGQVGKKKP